MNNADLILEKVDTLVACLNSAHTARSDGWKQGCFDAADRVLADIKELVHAPVAGEVAYWLIYQDYDHKVVRFAPGAEGKPVLADGYSAMPLYAAPQASKEK